MILKNKKGRFCAERKMPRCFDAQLSQSIFPLREVVEKSIVITRDSTAIQGPRDVYVAAGQVAFLFARDPYADVWR
eukprot:m.27398 g.27398  ORF g.27398 m.27398 type:complete len:76 (+) comp29984_c0_seq2:619-846(+)